MKRKLLIVIAMLLFITFIAAAVKTTTTMNKDINIKKIELKNTDAQLKNLQLEFDKLNKDLDAEMQNKVRNQQKIDELEKHRIELEKQLQAKNEAARTVANTITRTNTVHALSGNQFKDYIYQKESGNNPGAINSSSGACGIGQALPCSKLPCSLSDYACQDAWFTNYALTRYGSWEAAYNFWVANHWW